MIEWEQGYKAGYEDAMKDCNMTYEDFKKRNEEWREIMKAMGDDQRRRDAAAELTRLAQDMGMIP
jgi:hypothetical protein